MQRHPMQRIGKAFRRTPKAPGDNRNGKFQWLSGRVAHGFRYAVSDTAVSDTAVSLRRALLAENH